MKKTLLLLLMMSVLTGISSCMESSTAGKKETDETFHSDNSELEEAKAISRKIYEGIAKVEKKELSRTEFRAYAKPLQHKLNSLIVNMEEEDVKELDSYRNELMEELGAKVARQE